MSAFGIGIYLDWAVRNFNFGVNCPLKFLKLIFMWSPFQNELKLSLKWHRFRFKGFITAHEFTAYSQSSTTRNLQVVEIVECGGDLCCCYSIFSCETDIFLQ
jgi:hypothetical protein